MLLDAGIAGEKMIVVLQPRRVAARTVATRVARERECRLGAEVGYQIRLMTHTSVGTRHLFCHGGHLCCAGFRMIARCRRSGAVVFDEFHERNLLSDVALALVKHLQQTQRPDLADGGDVCHARCRAGGGVFGLMPDPSSPKGKVFPSRSAVSRCGSAPDAPCRQAEAVERILHDEDPGDILVFMPGRGEIQGTLDALRGPANAESASACIPLHGELEPQEQDRALRRTRCAK